MAVYVVGDLQGCYTPLCRLLESVNFDQNLDRVWFCGDLVNRGPESLKTLRFVKSLGDSAVSVLGNHDLHLLALFHSGKELPGSDTLAQILNAPDCAELMIWLQSRPLAHYDRHLNFLMVHAGVHRDWDLSQTIAFAGELGQMLSAQEAGDFFNAMYGNKPDRWSDDMKGLDRLRFITNVLTRLRFYTQNGCLDFEAKGGPEQHVESDQLVPWFEVRNRLEESVRVVFGHWSTLPVGQYGQYYAIDGGCVWGRQLIALQIDLPTPQWHSFDCQC